MRFFNSTQKNMNFQDVVTNIITFIKMDPQCKYRLAIGTDSQVKGRFTCFATGVHIHRVGQGAWCCIKKQVEAKRFRVLKEKIAYETAITYEIVCKLNEDLMDEIYEIAVRNKEFDFSLEAHIDVGKRGETRTLIREMVGYFEGIGIDAKIKPESFVASCYANRYSKSISERDQKGTFPDPQGVSPYLGKINYG